MINSGIDSMQWSPDFQLVVFSTGSSTILLMTKEWDVVVEANYLVNNVISTDISTSISWRGDGNFFACNYFDPSQGS